MTEQSQSQKPLDHSERLDRERWLWAAAQEWEAARERDDLDGQIDALRRIRDWSDELLRDRRSLRNAADRLGE